MYPTNKVQKMAIKVKVRQKPISGNKISLYLDFWPAITNTDTGDSTRREFLKMYLYAPLKKHKSKDKPVIFHKDKNTNEIYKKHNADTLTIAEGIRQKRENELNKPEVYSEFEREQVRRHKAGEADFLAYFKELTDKHTGGSYDNWMIVYNYLDRFTGGSLKVAEVTEKFCNDFRQFLLTTNGIKRTKKKLENNTASVYFSKFKAALRHAHRKDNVFPIDINNKIEPIKVVDTERNFLTLEELNKLAKTDSPDPLIKRAALLSALTGMRYSDIMKLTWKEINFVKGVGYSIRFRQKKTKGVETLPISDQAYSLLGDPRGPDDQVLNGLSRSSFHNKRFYQWIGAAGITKPVTFHSFRHTFATLQLTAGTSIFTVSKMLGHRSLSTTQIYAKVVDKLKEEAADRIKLDM
jgi:integrase